MLYQIIESYILYIYLYNDLFIIISDIIIIFSNHVGMLLYIVYLI